MSASGLTREQVQTFIAGLKSRSNQLQDQYAMGLSAAASGLERLLDPVEAPPVYSHANGREYVIVGSARLEVLDPQDGTQVWLSGNRDDQTLRRFRSDGAQAVNLQLSTASYRLQTDPVFVIYRPVVGENLYARHEPEFHARFKPE